MHSLPFHASPSFLAPPAPAAQTLTLQLELSYTYSNDMLQLVRLARHTAALQPDGSITPHQRCMLIAQELANMVDPSASARLSTIELTLARRIVHLAREKVGRGQGREEGGKGGGRGGGFGAEGRLG